MERAITRPLGELATAVPETGTAAPLASAPVRPRIPRWLLVVGFWTVIVLAYSTRTEVRSGTTVWVPVTWFESLKTAASQWYAWGLLSFGVYWLNRLLPFKRDALLARFLVHAPLSLVFTVAYTYLNDALATMLGATVETNWIGDNVLETLSRVTYRLGTFVYWAIAAICVALDYQSDLKDREVRTAKLERLLSEARLAALRRQLDPHFLFNTLNSVSAYVESEPRQARLMLEQLGDLLRMSLEHAEEQEIPLEREVAFVDHYVQLQLVRFADRLEVHVDVAPDVLGAAVPTFILQPLVENAIRHGVSKLTGQGRIEVAAWRDGERLRLRVRDNGPGLPPGWDPDRDVGIGLANTRERLLHLYGASDHALSVGADDDGGVRAEISLPFHVA
jgi:signal transduction histidine kinase